MAPPPSSSSPPADNLDTDPHTPDTRSSGRPRAPATPIHGDPLTQDPLNLSGLATTLPNYPQAAMANIYQNLPALQFPSTYSTPSHPILGININNHIKFQVNTAGQNFTKWRQIMVLLLTMYKCLDHITEGAAPPEPSDDWLAVDIHLSLWFMATLTDDLYRLVQGTDGRACSTWTRLKRFFLNHTTARYTYLSKALRTTPRGDLPISTYATKLQSIADDLAAIGRPVTDADLTMQFLDGVGKQYKLQAEILKGNDGLTFSDACSRLQLAEMDDASQQLSESAQALAVHGGGRGQPRGPAPSPRPAGVDPHYVSPNYKGKNPIPGYVHGGQHSGQGSSTPVDSWRGRGRGAPVGRGDPSGGRGGAQPPWVGYFAPMGASYAPPRHLWTPPNSSSVLGPRPGSQAHAYPTMHTPAPSAPLLPQPTPPPSWDQRALLTHAANYGSAFPAYGGDWIMDSGATSHVTGDPGPCNTGATHEVQ